MTLDWTEFDRRLGPYLDGSAFTAARGYWGPGYGLPLDHIMLPFNNEKHGNKATAWPIALPNKAGRPNTKPYGKRPDARSESTSIAIPDGRK